MTQISPSQGYPFQIGYTEINNITGKNTLPSYTLYLVATTDKERSEWIRAIRKVSEDFSPKSFRYHPGLFKINKWSCCKNVSRNALGCLVTTNWPEKNNNTKSKCEMELTPFFLFEISYIEPYSRSMLNALCYFTQTKNRKILGSYSYFWQ